MWLSMTITLELPPDIVTALVNQANSRSITLDAYLEAVIEELARSGVAYRDGPGRARTLRLASDVQRGASSEPSREKRPTKPAPRSKPS